MTEDILIFTVIILTSIAGFLLRSLTVSGAIAAIIVGMAVFIGFGARGLFLLGVFFSTSSLWSKYKSTYKKSIEEKVAKGSTRDWRQVIANGGFAALLSIIVYFHHDQIWLIGFAVCLASANSDTWASELGSLSRKDPIYIRTFKRIERGTSGAISILGSACALSGSFLIALISSWLFHLNIYNSFIVFLFGFIGNIIDTLVGAFYQQVFVCSQCRIETEKKFHCERATTRIKGYFIVDNDTVNFFSGFIASVLAMIFVK
ncbi:DUF92 domain-containing protein [Neobacillus ginsengisoli]|uniref:Uncharacterized protein (TIGR00297 family) n=1 Tax=Neobacillus ginsengisoli TaxID=904295 RepID=A0ABT9XP31_9BACI|nr:DUF92 domain-containing protein [Neobacillus ginsengisoli]MDQ0197298.1 uncharacterized protein (TIGR00297 family) [Neobacillus ginsengisoli]